LESVDVVPTEAVAVTATAVHNAADTSASCRPPSPNSLVAKVTYASAERD